MLLIRVEFYTAFAIVVKGIPEFGGVTRALLPRSSPVAVRTC
jgi:hypothetical protein